MGSPKKRRKRGPYKKYLNPDTKFKVPRSTLDSRARREHRGNASDVEPPHESDSDGPLADDDRGNASDLERPHESDSDGDLDDGVRGNASELEEPHESDSDEAFDVPRGPRGHDVLAADVETSDAESSYGAHNYEPSTAAEAPHMDSTPDDAESNGFGGDYEHSDYSFSWSECSSSDEESNYSMDPDANQPGSDTTHNPEIAGLFTEVLSRKLVVSKGEILMMVL